MPKIKGSSFENMESQLNGKQFRPTGRRHMLNKLPQSDQTTMGSLPITPSKYGRKAKKPEAKEEGANDSLHMQEDELLQQATVAERESESIAADDHAMKHAEPVQASAERDQEHLLDSAVPSAATSGERGASVDIGPCGSEGEGFQQAVPAPRVRQPYESDSEGFQDEPNGLKPRDAAADSESDTDSCSSVVLVDRYPQQDDEIRSSFEVVDEQDSYEFYHDDDDGLDDFIVSDDASEEELRKGSKAKKGRSQKEAKPQSAAPSRKGRMRYVVLDSDSEEDGGDEKAIAKQVVAIDSVESGDDTEGTKEVEEGCDVSDEPGDLSQRDSEDDLDENPFLHYSPRNVSPVKIQKKSDQVDVSDEMDSEDDIDWPGKRKVQPMTPKGGKSSKLAQQTPAQLKKAEQAARRKAKESKRLFSASKHDLAWAWLEELDATVTKGRIEELTSETGGVKIIWSRTLNKTAGRASWKREWRGKGKDMVAKVFAKIELAEKVLDNEERLRTTLAHEFCHLAVFLLNNPKAQGHGPEFKSWAAKTMSAFPDVTITTKHNYEIDYRYVWECSKCGQEYKRHSRSIDPAKVVCGRGCKGKLVQVRPTPRSGATEADGDAGEGKAESKKRTGGEYQNFVKANYSRVKAEMQAAGAPDVSMGAVTKRVAAEYKVSKEKEGKKNEKLTDGPSRLDDVAEKLNGLELTG